VDDQEKGRMVAVARELPNAGYALEVDGCPKTEFETKEGAWTGAEQQKKLPLRCSNWSAKRKTCRAAWNSATEPSFDGSKRLPPVVRGG
jgi:hypothetical protein